MHDPLSDFLNTLKMASRTGKSSFVFPSSRFIVAVAGALAKKGYLAFAKKGKRGQHIEVALSSGEKVLRAVSTKRISRLSKRVYRKAREIRPVRQGSGVAILSTPKGVLTDEDARAAKVGGEVLFEIW